MALLGNDGSTGNRRRTTMSPYKTRRMTEPGEKRMRKRRDEDDDDNVYNNTQRCGGASRRCSLSRAGIRSTRGNLEVA